MDMRTPPVYTALLYEASMRGGTQHAQGHIVGENGGTSMEGLRALRRALLPVCVRGSIPLLVIAATLFAGPASASAILSRAPGSLSPLASPSECVGEEEGEADSCGTKIPSGLTLGYQTVVSPDGLNVYAVAISGALTEYARDPATGALSEIGCITASAKPCAKSNSTEGISLMSAPTSIAITPNGENVYVTVQGQNAVVELEREPVTGLLKVMGEGKACVTLDAGGECEHKSVPGLNTPYGIAVSPDDKNVYVVSAQNEALVELERSTTTGLLAPVSGHECIGGATSGCPLTTAIGMFEPIGVRVSPDGNNVYVAAGASNELGDVAAFKRGGDGILSQLSGAEGCIGSAKDCAPATAPMEGSEDLAVSPDGQNVYATSFGNSAVIELERDGTTGSLTQLAGNNHCITTQEIDGCTQVKGIGNTRGVAISPDGANVYVSSTIESAVAAFSRDSGTGALTQLAEPHECLTALGTGCGTKGVHGLTESRRVTVSPDGTNVYVAAQDGNAIAELARAVMPEVTAVEPDEGSEDGGSEVTIKGKGFIEGATVSFGGKEASNVIVESASAIKATAPAGPRGELDVTVTTSAGSSEKSSNDKFFYVPPHLLGGMDIEAYCESIGDHGNGGSASTLLRGTTSGPEFAFHNWACVKNNGTTVEIAETGPAPSMEDLCAVQYPTASSFAFPSDPNNAFSWNCFALEPKVTSVRPKAIGTSGGPIAIKGEDLKGAKGVSVGGVPGEITSVVSADEVTANAPAHPVGPADVVVATPGGESPTSTKDRVTYVTGPTISKVEPKEGPEAGGTHVKIAGESLEAGSVSFGGVEATILRETATELEVQAPSHSAGAEEVQFTGPAGEASGGPENRFTYIGEPTITAIEPDEGPAAGDVSAKITGTNFTAASEVKFGSNASEHVEFKSPDELIARVPSGTGTVGVCVSTAGGAKCKPSAFTYVSPPKITSIAPREGKASGGRVVTISGENFTRASEVLFGPTPAAKTEVVSSTEIQATSPPGAGSVELFVKTAGGIAGSAASEEFTYRGVPAVTSVVPNEGPEGGGTMVVIHGENLEAAKAVTFGGATAKIHTDTAEVIEAESPAVHASGPVDVVVSTEGGTSATSSADEFTYRSAPTIGGISPSEGPDGGGTPVRITGTGFTKSSEVQFGTTASEHVEFKSSTELVATSPGGSGTTDVRVRTTGGTSAKLAADEFTYLAAPVVTAISPSEGPTAGGTAVKITGSNFTKKSEVKFGAGVSDEVEFKNSTELVAHSPTGAGTVAVTVTTAGGTSLPILADEFTYRPKPQVSTVSPEHGPAKGGTPVTITGTNLAAAKEVTFNGAHATIEKDSATEVEVITPGQEPGIVEVCVITGGGTSCKLSAFTYEGPPPPPPVLQAVAPAEGSTGGGTTVKVTGEELSGAIAVKFEGVAVTSFVKDTATEVELATPPHAEGPVEVCVTTGGGTSCKAAAFTYVVPPKLTAVSPREGPEVGGTALKLSGEHLAGASAVEVGTTQVTTFSKDTASSIELASPGHAPGAVEVCAITAGGRSCLPSAFTYRAIPSIASLKPNEGPTGGGTSVTVAGEHLEGATEVKFGTTMATSFQVVTDHEIKAKAPAGTGSALVTVTTPGGTSSGSPDPAAEFTYRLAPSVGSIAPKEGPESGGTVVTITGNHLEHATEVRFGTVKATSFEVKSETEAKAIAPAHAPGLFDVVVVTPGGQSATSGADRYLFVAKPVVHTVVPNEGPEGGGETITLVGEHLEKPSAVKFGGVGGSQLNPISAAELTVKNPRHEGAGRVPVAVSTPGGESAVGSADAFTYAGPEVLPPKVFSVSPQQGSAAGGTLVTITGENFVAPAKVLFGGAEGANVRVLSSTEITATSPAHGAGTVGVVVKTAGGESANTEADPFTYVASPASPGPAASAASTSTPASSAPPPPVLASTGNVAPVSGVVLIELPGTTTFVPLTSLKQIPFGTIIDATHGRVSVTTATARGGTQTGEFFDGEFALTQGRGGLVVATLVGGSFSVCPRHGGAAKARHARTSAARASGKHVVRKLWANAHGSFSTKGNYAAGAVQGTEWLTEDLCEGTLIRVTRDKVKVTNLVTHRHTTVRLGHHYLAKAP